MKKKHKQQPTKQQLRPKPARQQISLDELRAIVERATVVMAPGDVQTLRAAVDTLAVLAQEIDAKGASIQRLRNLIFGSRTEKLSQIFPGAPDNPGTSNGGAEQPGDGEPVSPSDDGASPSASSSSGTATNSKPDGTDESPRRNEKATAADPPAAIPAPRRSRCRTSLCRAANPVHAATRARYTSRRSRPPWFVSTEWPP